MEKQSFILYKSYYKLLKKLTHEQAGRLLMAIYDKLYETGTDAQLDAVTDMVFEIISERLESDSEKYIERCRVNSENGKKGGRPKKTDGFCEEPKKADTDTDTDTDTDSDTDTETDTDTDTECDNKRTLGENGNAQKRLKRGAHGFVVLTDKEYARLVKTFGEDEVKRIIAYLDESAASTNNKNGWSNWEIVISRAINGKWGTKHKEAETPRALDYPQKHYSEDDLKAMGIEIFGDDYL